MTLIPSQTFQGATTSHLSVSPSWHLHPQVHHLQPSRSLTSTPESHPTLVPSPQRVLSPYVDLVCDGAGEERRDTVREEGRKRERRGGKERVDQGGERKEEEKGREGRRESKEEGGGRVGGGIAFLGSQETFPPVPSAQAVGKWAEGDEAGEGAG